MSAISEAGGVQYTRQMFASVDYVIISNLFKLRLGEVMVYLEYLAT
jgi:hypothetical protein